MIWCRCSRRWLRGKQEPIRVRCTIASPSVGLSAHWVIGNQQLGAANHCDMRIWITAPRPRHCTAIGPSDVVRWPHAYWRETCQNFDLASGDSFIIDRRSLFLVEGPWCSCTRFPTLVECVNMCGELIRLWLGGGEGAPWWRVRG